MDKNKFDFDDDLIDFSGNVRFNFDTVVFSTIMSLNRVFDGDVSLEQGFSKYRHLVEHLVVIAGSAGMLPNNYDDLERDFVKSVPDGLNDYERSAFIARKKLQVVVASVQKKTPIRGSLKVN